MNDRAGLPDQTRSYLLRSGRDARPLRGTPVRLLLVAALKDAGPQPQPDEPQDARIDDPMRHYRQQPLVVDRVEGRIARLPITKTFQRR